MAIRGRLASDVVRFLSFLCSSTLFDSERIDDRYAGSVFRGCRAWRPKVNGFGTVALDWLLLAAFVFRGGREQSVTIGNCGALPLRD